MLLKQTVRRRYVIMTAVVASSGGLMFGYDNGVTGGVTGMHHFLRRFFPTVRSDHSSAVCSSAVSSAPRCRVHEPCS